MKRGAACLGLALAVSISESAASPAGELQLVLRDCPALSESALREHLELELTTLQLSQVAAQLDIRCEGGSAAIELTASSGHRFPVGVRVDLRDTARAARERLIALAASELVAQAERERERERDSEQPGRLSVTLAEPAKARDVAALEPPRRRRSSQLYLAGSVALDGEPRTALWGGSLGALLGLGRHWSVLFDTRFEHGEARVELASVRWSALSGFAGSQLGTELGPLRPSLGFGVRAGWLALSADAQAPHEGRSLTAPWAGLALPLRLALDVRGNVSPFVGAEGGFIIVPVRGNVDGGRALVEQRGFWLSGSVGVGLEL